MEKGEGTYRSLEIRELCRVYGVSAAETEELAGLCERLPEERIWDDYTDLLPGAFGTLVDLEGIAEKIRTYNPSVMPGLLQTLDYARAVFQAASPPLPFEEVERLIMVRKQRQRSVFEGWAGTAIYAVLDEGVLARKVGGEEVMAGQLEHLHDLINSGRVSVRVLTNAAGAHPGMHGSFSVLEFANPEEPNVAYVESRAGARLLNKPAQYASYRDVFGSLTKLSIPLEEYAT